jgi:hypothetical protein
MSRIVLARSRRKLDRDNHPEGVLDLISTPLF